MSIGALEGIIWFSKLDAKSAFWQIPLAEDSKEKTSFRCRDSTWQFTKMPFGLSNSPSIYCRALALVLKGLGWKTVLAFLDDICVLGRTTQEHFHNLKEVFERFRQYGLKLKPKKCKLFKQEVEFLGRLVGRNGIALTDHSLDTIRKWKAPTSIKQVESFLGLANYHRSHIKNFSKIADPLNRLLKKKIFYWEIEQEEAFFKT